MSLANILRIMEGSVYISNFLKWSCCFLMIITRGYRTKMVVLSGFCRKNVTTSDQKKTMETVNGVSVSREWTWVWNTTFWKQRKLSSAKYNMLESIGYHNIPKNHTYLNLKSTILSLVESKPGFSPFWGNVLKQPFSKPLCLQKGSACMKWPSWAGHWEG
jgi:hypothetical protein